MPITRLDPVSALIVVDIQQGLLAGPANSPMHGVVARTRLLADAFRAQQLPVILVQVTGTPPGRTEYSSTGSQPRSWTELATELGVQPQDHLVIKQTWNSFTNTDLEAYLKSMNVTQVVLAGVATSLGVESTARAAYDLGFNVTLATDASMDRSLEAHRYATEQLYPLIAETGEVQDIITLLGSSSRNGRGA